MILTVAGDEWTEFDANADLTGATLQLLVQRVGGSTSIALTTEPVTLTSGIIRANTQALVAGKYAVQLKVTQGPDGPSTFPLGTAILLVQPSIPQP